MESIRVRAESVTPCRLLPRALAATLLLSLSALALPSAAQEAPAPRPATAALEALEEARSLGKLGGVAYDQLLQHMAGQSRIRVIVQFEDQNDPDAGLTGPQARTATAFNARKAAITRLYQRLTSRLQTLGIGPAKPFSNIPFMSLELNADELSTLAQQPEVASIHIDEQMHLSLFDTVPQIGADSAWLDGYTGNGQVIAVLDAGFDTAHSAFAGRIVDEACYSTTSFIDNTVSLCPNGSNPNGADSQVGAGAAINCTGMLGCDHGTHVAGIAASSDETYRGIAPDAGILPIQVFSQLNDLFACGFEPSCLVAFSSDIIRGLERVYELRDTHDFAVVNMSLGGEAYTTAAACDAAYPAIKAAVDNLRAAGITTVVASGNEYRADAIATPACLSSAVSVGAVDVIDTVAEFSNSADFLDVLSGGVGIVSAVPGNTFDGKTGTSMASPGVAGAVAVLRSADPGATPDEIVDAIKTTGVPVVDWRNDVVTPRVQVDAAANLLVDGQLGRITLALVPELSGLDEPVGVAHAGDASGRLFIMQRDGTVLVRDQGGVLPAPFLDVSNKVACCTSDGLLGLAFHPNYASDGQVFVSYLTGLGEIVVERYSVSVDPNQVDSTSASEVLRIASTPSGHHGGRLHFGADGYLYLATGDGAVDGTVPEPGPSGDPASPLGKILRIDVDAPGVAYAIPPDNPLVGVAGALEEIWAVGLRDPRRFAFDALSGELYVADVGESEAHEVNVQAADSTGGEDYGWNAMEGSACRAGLACDPTGFVLPVIEYGFNEGCAVTGGVVYRGVAHPDLYGAYLFGDLCSGRIWGLRSEDGEWRHVQMTQAAVQVSAFGSDEDGETYLVDQAAGQIYRLELSDLSIDTVRLPTVFTGVPYSETLTATGGATPYQWSIVDGTLPTGLGLDPLTGTLSGTTDTPLTTVLTVQLQDAQFATVSRTLRLVVTPPPLEIDTKTLPAATIDRPYSETLVASGGTPPYTAWTLAGGSLPLGITFANDGTLSGLAAEQGIFRFTAQVTDSAGEQTIQDLSLRVYGATIALSLNDPVPGPFGNDYGSDQHLLGLFATFTGGTQELTFHATGYDIDYADELAVYVNDNLLGYVTVGPNNALSTRDVFTIPLSVQVPGENVLLLRNRTSGFVWGVADLLLSDQPAPLVITTQTLPDATVAVPYSASLEASGGRGAYTWSLVSGAPPLGLTLNDDGSVTGTSTVQGTFTFTARVTDDLGTSIDQTFTMLSVGTSGAIEVPLTIGDMDTTGYGHNYGSNEHPIELYASFTGTGQDLTLYVTGYDIDYADELAVSLNGTLLGHLSVGPNNGLNAGDTFAIPATAQEGTNLLHFKVKTSGWTWGITNLLLSHEAAPLTITTTALPDATVTQGYSTTLEASGGRTPYAWSLTAGSLPSGLALNPDGSISGTPTEQGTFAFTARVTDNVGTTTDQAFTLISAGTSGTIEITLEVGNTDPGSYGNNYGSNEHPTELYASFTGTTQDLTLFVTGYDIDYADELAVRLNGTLLGHLSVGPNNGVNAGDAFAIPAGAQQEGANLLHFKVKTKGWTWGVTGLLLTDQPGPLSITTTALPDATDTQPYSTVLEASGGRAPYTWSLTAGSLPLGLTLNSDGSITGTPTEQGTFAFTARVTDADNTFVEQAFTLRGVGTSGTIEVPLTIGFMDTNGYGHNYGSSEHPTELYASFTGTNQDLTLYVTGYDIDYADELAVRLNGTLLGHLSVGPNNDVNTGDSFVIPADAQDPGTNLLHFKVKTNGWTWGITDLLLTDQAAPLTITTTTLPDATATQGYTTTLEASGGRAPYIWSLTLGSLPSGLALNPDGSITGTPTEQGTFDFTARVTDANGDVADRPLTLQAVGTSGTFELVLQVGVMETGEYGWKWGTNEHKVELYASFTGTAGDLTLNVTGYDIDYADELAVYLNGNLIGHLTKGPNNRLNAGDSFSIPATAQLPGTNLLRFKVRNSGWKWGVTDLLLTP
jgi:subtilisin family serine protease/ABC-type amino acid transport substrate-binding protein